jgi:prolyl-tRNA synthetase
MVHADDDGLRLPPKVAPKQVVIIPMLNKPGEEEKILAYAKEVADDIRQRSWAGAPVTVHVDERDQRPVDKKWQWVKRGAPIRLEIGARDMADNAVFMGRRDRSVKAAESVGRDRIAEVVVTALDEIQDNLFEQANTLLKEHTYTDIADFAAFEAFFTPKNEEKPEIHGGFVRSKYCENPECEEKAAGLKVTIRCLPFDQSGSTGKCVICGSPAKTDAIWAKAY